MKRIALLFMGLLLGATTVNAQKFTVGINFGMALPLGENNTNFIDGVNETSLPVGFGIGGVVDVNYWFSDAVSAGIEVGYFSFSEKTTSIDAPFVGNVPVNSSQIGLPILAKVNYHFLDGPIRPYAGVGVGYFMLTPKRVVEIPGFPPFIEPSKTELKYKQNGFLISPRLGILYQLSDLIALNFNVQYNLVLNGIDGTIEIEVDGQKDSFDDVKADSTNYLGINVGAIITLFE